MGWTKFEFVQQAYDELGLGNYVFDLEPDQIEKAVRRLDSMMASLNVNGIRIGYPLPSSPGKSNINQQTNVPDWANEAIYLNLAIRIAPSVGKTVSLDTKQNADDAFKSLIQQASGLPPQMQFPGTMPAGNGNKPWRRTYRPFLNQPVDNLWSGNDGEIEFD